MIIKEIESLSKPYISVQGTYGGSQTFFRGLKGYFNKCKDRAGCGIVAISDVLAYLQGRVKFDTTKDYMKYFNHISRRAFWFPNSSGLSFIQQQAALGVQLLVRRMPYKNFWGFSRKKLYPRIKEMLSHDIPVILCIPRVLGKRSKTEFITFYNSELLPAEKTNGHFVVVTGIVEIENKLYLRISSWGREYYLSYEDYVNFLKSHVLGLLGNIMCIKRI